MDQPAGIREKTVTVKSDTGSWRYSAQPYSQTVKVSADKSEATIPNAPVDGSRYVVTVDNAGGTTATATGEFADAAIEPYPACSVTWNGDSVTLVRPETQDWRYLYMTEKWADESGKQQEKQLGANYTYSQNTPPITGIIHGRTTPESYTKFIPAGHELWVQIEDYNGNKTDPVKIPTADKLAKCAVADPTQPDAKKSTLTAVDGSAVADGKATRTVQATVKDSFGNPLINAEVAFTLPEGVTAADGNTTVKTDAAGAASLNVVSTKVGKYTVKAALGSKAIGEGVTIKFTKVVADKSGLQKSIDAAKALKESGYIPQSWKAVADALKNAEAIASKRATPDEIAKAKDTLDAAVKALVAATPNKPGDQNKSGDNKSNKPGQNSNKNNDKNGASLSATGSSVIAIVAAAVVLLGAGGSGVPCS